MRLGLFEQSVTFMASARHPSSPLMHNVLCNGREFLYVALVISESTLPAEEHSIIVEKNHPLLPVFPLTEHVAET